MTARRTQPPAGNGRAMGTREREMGAGHSPPLQRVARAGKWQGGRMVAGANGRRYGANGGNRAKGQGTPRGRKAQPGRGEIATGQDYYRCQGYRVIMTCR
ncbi:hypothetical protein NL676_038606 [Syzygium grande]|nr:hypothetical protein NL676_038606 [Syzygium grande]